MLESHIGENSTTSGELNIVVTRTSYYELNFQNDALMPWSHIEVSRRVFYDIRL